MDTVSTEPDAGRAPTGSAGVGANGHVPTWRLLGYALPASALAILALPVLVFVPTLYAQELGVSAAVISIALVATRVVDVITDPMVGVASDHTRSALGRRRTWMILGMPLLFLAAWALFLPPETAGAMHLVLSLIGVYAFGTMLIVPMNAWGAELSDDTHERTRIVAIRTAFGLVGVLLALIVPSLAGLGADDVREWTRLVAFMGLGLLPFAVLTACLSTPDQTRPAPPKPDALKGWQAARVTLGALSSNAPLRRLLGTFLLNMIATGVPASLFLLFAKHKLEAPDSAGVWLVLFFGSSIASLPLWTWLAKRLGKREAWIAGMLAAGGFFVAAPFLGPGQTGLYTFIVVATGVCAGANLAIPASMLADITEADADAHGSSRAGLFFSIWGSISKLSGVIGGGLAWGVLAVVGFDAQLSQNTPGAVWALALTYGGVPALLNFAAAGILAGYRAPVRTAHSQPVASGQLG